jgi:magnesium-transporting ATPase (P-type)
MGYHLYDINFSSVSQATHLIIWYYLSQIFWLVVIYFIKMSILFLYLRIFPEIPLFRYCVIGTMVFTTVAVIILVPMDIWQCVPIHAIWDLKREDARCLSIAGVAYASAGVNIATELAVLILPLPLLRTLRASIAQKIGLYALFGCGIL